jgi:hypothetical protein
VLLEIYNKLMKNYYLLWGVLALVLVLGLLLINSGDTVDDTDDLNISTTTEEVITSPVSQTKSNVTLGKAQVTESFTNIFPQKGNFECLYEEVTPSRRTSNVIYFSDGKMRGEFRTVGGPSNIMLYDGKYLYTWAEGQSTGTMTYPKSISDFPPIVPKDIYQGKVLGSGLNNVSWDCHAWSKDSSLLVRPSYVKFQ